MKTICDGAEFKCPFCSSKLKLKVIASPAKTKGKPMANRGNCLFLPPGGMCRAIPSVQMPCTPAAFVTDPGQSVLTIQCLPALASTCKFQCAKGGSIELASKE